MINSDVSKIHILNITKKCFREESKNRSKLKEGMNLATKKQAGKYGIDGESGPQIVEFFLHRHNKGANPW